MAAFMERSQTVSYLRISFLPYKSEKGNSLPGKEEGNLHWSILDGLLEFYKPNIWQRKNYKL